jgi:hypothetical protein
MCGPAEITETVISVSMTLEESRRLRELLRTARTFAGKLLYAEQKAEEPQPPKREVDAWVTQEIGA